MDVHADGKTQFAFEQKVHTTPSPRHRVHRSGIAMLPDIFMGYALNKGGGWPEIYLSQTGMISSITVHRTFT